MKELNEISLLDETCKYLSRHGCPLSTRMALATFKENTPKKERLSVDLSFLLLHCHYR